MNVLPDTFALWAMNHHPDWLASNAGLPDMRIMSGTLHDVHYARERVAMIAKNGETLDIRDLSGQTIYTVREIPNPGHNPTLEVVDIFDRPAQRAERKPRRTLGKGTTA